MSRKMSLKDSTSVASPPVYSKFKSRSRDVDSPKSVISDPRIVSPASSASTSLERRQIDLKKQPRHDRVHSISDADDGTLLVGNLTTSRRIPAKGSNGHNQFLGSVREAHFLPSLPPRLGQTSGPSSESSSPQSKMSRNVGKKGTKGGGYDSEFTNRRMSSAGADFTTSSIHGALLHPTDHERVETESFTCSPPKSCGRGVPSDSTRRTAAGVRDPTSISLHFLDREPLQGIRPVRDNSVWPVNLQSEGKAVPVGSMYNILMNGFKGPTVEQQVSGRRTLRSGDSILRDSLFVQNDPGLPYEDQIEFNKFVVRGAGADEIRAREHVLKVSSSHGTVLDHLNLFSGDGRPGVSGYRQSRSSKPNLPLGDSPGHPSGLSEWQRSTFEPSSDEMVKTTAQGGKDHSEMQILAKDTHTYSTKSVSNGDCSDKNSSDRSMDGWKKPFDGQVGDLLSSSMLPDVPPSLHALPPLQSHPGGPEPESYDSERSFQNDGRVHGAGEASKGSMMPQQKLMPGQFLKPTPLKPRPPPAKWDDAEKWLVNPSTKPNAHSLYGNGGPSGGSSSQHLSQLQASGAGKHHQLPASIQAPRLLGVSGDAQSYAARLHTDIDKNGPNSNSCAPTNVSDSSTTAECVRHERSPPLDAKQTKVLYHDDSVIRSVDKEHLLQEGAHFEKTKSNLLLAVDKLVREKLELRQQSEDFCESVDLQDPKKYQKQDPFSESIFDQFTKDKFTDTITVQSSTSNNGSLIIVMKDAATEITPSTSRRDIATQITPVPSFHAPSTPPRLHDGGAGRLNTTPVHSERRPASVGVDVTELQNCHQAKLYLDEAAGLDMNWTTREEEVEESSKRLRLSVSRSIDFNEVKRNVLEARASAWEEAEQSKYMARYHREEARILAWEAHQKAKAEADLRKMEVKLERMRSHATELLQNKLASVHLRAENMRAAAAAECGEQAAKTSQLAQEIRTNARPSSPRLCCFPRLNPFSSI